MRGSEDWSWGGLSKVNSMLPGGAEGANVKHSCQGKLSGEVGNPPRKWLTNGKKAKQGEP